MAILQYVDTEGNIKDLAELDSPSFIGQGTTNNPLESNEKQLVNYRYLKRLIEKSINSVNAETVESTSNVLKGLVPGAEYLVNMYGINSLNCDPLFPYEVVWANNYPDSYIFVGTSSKVFVNDTETPMKKGYVKIGYFALLNKKNDILAKSSSKVLPIDWPNDSASFPDSVSMIVTAPADGFIYGYMNYGMSYAAPIPVSYMSAVRLNSNEIKTYKATIIQQANQTVVVDVDGVEYKENFTVEPGKSFTTKSIGYPGWRGGEVSPSSGVFDRNTIFTVSAAAPTTYIATIEQTPHQVITVNYNGVDYTSTIRNIPLNAVLVARISSVDYGYNPGRVTATNIKVKEDITITASEVTPIPYAINITQQANEIIRVTNNGITRTESFNAPYLSRIRIVIESLVSSEYYPGDLIISGLYEETEVENEFIVAGEISITASSVKPKSLINEGG